MIGLMIAAALAQSPARPADPCNALAPPAGMACPQWRFVRRNEQGEAYLDPASVVRDGDRVELMTRTVLHQPIAGGARSFTTRLQLDCRARTARPLNFLIFDAAGTQVHELPGEPAVPARPDTPFAALLDEFCPPG